jgi:uroporphyrinogen-III synthase
MRLLVTRPEPDASRTAAALRARGHAVDIAPMMAIVPAAQPSALPKPAAIVVTSRNAVRAIDDWPAAKQWRTLPLFAVGTATAELARAGGFADVRVANGNAGELVDLIRRTFDPARGTMLYAAGHDRSADLAAMLPGYAIATIEAYRGVAATALPAPVADAIRAGAYGAALFFSRRTAAIFSGLVSVNALEAAMRQIVFLALSAAVGEPLNALHPRATKVARRPDEESMLALVEEISQIPHLDA